MGEEYVTTSTITCTSDNDLYVFPISNLVVLTPTTEIDTSTKTQLTLETVSTPPFGAPQTWTGKVWNAGEYTDSYTYYKDSATSEAMILTRETTTDIEFAIINEGLRDPYVSRTDKITIKLVPVQDITPLGMIQITFVKTDELANISSNCWVQSGCGTQL